MHLAQFNYARLRHPVDDPKSRGFLDGSRILGDIANRSPGFVWAWNEDSTGGVPHVPVWGDPLISCNMSVWEDRESLEHFVFNTLHKSWIKRRREWFLEVPGQYLVLWEVPRGFRPTLDEGIDRLVMAGNGWG